MAYNPYKAVRSIAEQKDGWYKANKSGQDTKQYQQAALPYYKELYDNGFSQYADALQGSNNIHAWELLSEWGLKPDEQFAIDEAYNAVTGSGNSGDGAGQAGAETDLNGIGTPYANANGVNPEIQKLLDMTAGGSDNFNNLMGQSMGLATGQVSPRPSQTVDQMLGAWQRGEDRLNGTIQYDQNGNVVNGLNTEHYNIGRNQLDYLNNFDVTKQPYYEGIMNQFRLNGANAANDAYASGAANNGGNIDSYAAANANRQQLAFTTAGQQAALAAAQQNQQNWQALYSQMSQDLNNQGVLNANTLQYMTQMYQKDADERMNALDVAGGLEKQAMTNRLTALQELIAERMAETGLSYEQVAKQMDIQKEMYKIATEAETDLRKNENDNARAMYESDNLLTGTLDKNAKDLTGTMYKSDNDLTGTMYKADSDLAGTNIKAQADMYGASQDAYARIRAAEENANASRYTADQNYNAAIDKLITEAGLTQQQAEWYLANGLDATGKYPGADVLKALGINVGDDMLGNLSQNINWDPAEVAEAFIGMIKDGKTDDLDTWGLSGVHNVNDLSNVLVHSYGFTDQNGKLTEFYKSLATIGKNWGYKDTDAFLAALEEMLPGITTSYNTAIGKGAKATTAVMQ